jgi:hypothetical protein
MTGLLVVATFGATPCQIIRRQQPAWSNFSTTVPLLIGLFVGYVAGAAWDAGVDVSDRLSCTIDSALECQGAIAPEYFAQLSQIIPLLLVGVGLDAAFFSETIRNPVQRAALIVTIVVLFLGEILAITALVRKNEGTINNVLQSWHEYFSFVFVFQSAAVGLAALAGLSLQDWRIDDP